MEQHLKELKQALDGSYTKHRESEPISEHIEIVCTACSSVKGSFTVKYLLDNYSEEGHRRCDCGGTLFVRNQGTKSRGPYETVSKFIRLKTKNLENA